jgi:hypothetical protein
VVVAAAAAANLQLRRQGPLSATRPVPLQQAEVAVAAARPAAVVVAAVADPRLRRQGPLSAMYPAPLHQAEVAVAVAVVVAVAVAAEVAELLRSNPPFDQQSYTTYFPPILTSIIFF